VIIHPQSVIHSFVHFADGSVKAQLGVPDMRVPILYALTYPNRLKSDLPRLDFSKYNSLTFYHPDLKKFRNLSLAYIALDKGGNMPCMMNAANEVAVESFLDGRIKFTEMPDIVENAMNATAFSAEITIELLQSTDEEARKKAIEFIKTR